MRAARLKELEEMAAKLLETARKLHRPPQRAAEGGLASSRRAGAL